MTLVHIWHFWYIFDPLAEVGSIQVFDPLQNRRFGRGLKTLMDPTSARGSKVQQKCHENDFSVIFLVLWNFKYLKARLLTFSEDLLKWSWKCQFLLVISLKKDPISLTCESAKSEFESPSKMSGFYCRIHVISCSKLNTWNFEFFQR